MQSVTTLGLVYLVDDDHSVRKLVSVALKENNFEVHHFSNGLDLLDAITRKTPDVVILDWIMTPMDGLAVWGRLKIDKKTKCIPVIMLTAKTDEVDCVVALEMGVSDYIKKPFSVKELIARVKAVTERKNSFSNEYIQNDEISIGDIKINLSNRTAMKREKYLNLTMKEFDLLVNLINEGGKVLTREQLMSHVWAVDFCGDARTVDVHIRYLRKKIEDEADNPKYVITVRGIGYRIVSSEELAKVAMAN
ncbi:MAG: response regulator transcription factor [Candidatus Improbicoccus devescovinae]|nr:MAG: response regulator transcription factor [Candidatus Improbicoccus devescovinae]